MEESGTKLHIPLVLKHFVLFPQKLSVCGRVSSSLSGMTEKNKSFKTNIPMNNSKKITWKQILHAIIQAAIAALTALGVTSCTTLF